MKSQLPNKKEYKNFWMFKAPMQLKTQLDRVRIERIKSGKDRQMRSYNRLGLAIARHEKFLQELINADMIEEKR